MVKLITTAHPRLFINDSRIEELKVKAGQDPFLKKILDNLRMQAYQLEQTNCVGFKITGPRMLSNCQEISRRVRLLALMARLDGNERFAYRALDELINAADYPHWNKDHFLDTAELITAFAIAYDWLYDILPVAKLDKIKKALINKGIRVGLKEHENNIWWAGHKYNWNQVCNGSLIIGALAIADEESKLCEDVFAATVKYLATGFNSFGKDGGWEAGPEYWQYTTWFSALLLDVLAGVTGGDFNLSSTEGLEHTGLFPIYSGGPTNLYFNFSDGDETRHSLPVLFWLGERYGLDACIDENHRLLRMDIENAHPVDAFNVIWYKQEKGASDLPLSRLFSDINAAYIRSDWDNPEAAFIGFKGGYNQSDHAHLDLGTFVLDMKGVRWAKDLGRDNYDLPGYFDLSEGGGRWKYFRLNNNSHNTLVINDDIQRAEAKAMIIDFGSDDSGSYGKIDFTEAYLPHVSSLVRSIILKGENQVIMSDEIRWKSGFRKVRWQITTDAEIYAVGNRAELRKEGQLLELEILEPAGAAFRIVNSSQIIPGASEWDFSQLFFELEDEKEKTELIVQFFSL